MMSDPPTPSELPIPRRPWEHVLAISLTLIMAYFFVLAACLITDWEEVVGAVLLLLLFAVVVWRRCRKEGARKYLIGTIAAYSHRHLVWCDSSAGHTGEVRFGYRLFGRRFGSFAIPLDRIECVELCNTAAPVDRAGGVEWTTGRDPATVRQDVADWYIAVWYDHGDPATSERRRGRLRPDQDMYTIWPSRRTERVQAFGRAFVALLQQAGASLVQGVDEYTFVRQKHVS